MRAVRLVGVVALGAVVCATVATAWLSAWALGPGAPSGRPAAVRTDAPVGLGAGAAPALRVRIETIDGSPSDRWIVVENPNARPVAGVRATTTVAGGTCHWVDGPFPTPFGLAPGSSTGRTCRLAVEPGGRAILDVTVDIGGRRLAVASDAVNSDTVPPPDLPPVPTEDRPALDHDDLSGPSGPAPPADPAPGPSTMPPPCPRLADGLDLPAAPGLDQFGPALTDRARLVEVEGCPAWAAVGSLVTGRTAGEAPCPPWSLQLQPGAGPVAHLTSPQQEGCPLLPLQVEVWGQPTERAAQLATLAAWAVEGSAERMPELHRAAATGTGLACGGATVALSAAYEQQAGAHRVYRVTVSAC